MTIEGEKNKLDNPDILRVLTEFAGLAIEEEKLNHGKGSDVQGEINDIVIKKEKLFKELLGYGLSEGEIFEAVDDARDEMEKLEQFSH